MKRVKFTSSYEDSKEKCSLRVGPNTFVERFEDYPLKSLRFAKILAYSLLLDQDRQFLFSKDFKESQYYYIFVGLDDRNLDWGSYPEFRYPEDPEEWATRFQ